MEDQSNTCLFLLLRGKEIDPDEVTALLGIIPTTKHGLGDRHGKNKEMVWKTGLWLLESTQNVKSEEIEEHAIWILDQLEPVKSQFASIMTKNDVYIELRIIYSLFRHNWVSMLSAKTIRRLAELNIPIGISIWYLGYSDEANELEY